MNKKLIEIVQRDGELVVSSRQIAEDFEKMHKHVLRAIEDKISVNPILGSGKYFIESSYKDGSGKGNKEYLLTKDGFTFLVMGFTGAKADSWKLKYIEAFNKMEQELRKPQKQLTPMEMMELQFGIIKEHGQKLIEVDDKVEDLKDNMPLFQIDCKEIQASVRKKGIETLKGKTSPAYKDNSLRARVYRDIHNQLHREFGVTKYEAIKRSQLDKAKEIVESYRVPIVLEDEIIMINSQIDFQEWA